MKLARWIFTWELATFRGDGHPVMHAYVPGSSAPICMPTAAGEPPTGIDAPARACPVCNQRLESVFWGWAPISERFERFTWAVRCGYPNTRRARGTADDATDAFRQCIEALDRILPGDVPASGYRAADYDAEQYAAELRADARALKPSKATGTQLTEYAYRHQKRFTDWFSSAFVWETEKAEITRKTEKRIFVKASTRVTEKGNTVLRTYSFDRAELESGKKSRYGWTLDPNPPFDAATGKPGVPGWAEVLGLSMPCTLAQAKRAFRTAAKVAHPDHGGTPEAFQRVKAAFDAATQHLARAS